MKVFYFTSESDGCGMSTELFATEAEMRAAHAEFVTAVWEDIYPRKPLPTRKDGAPDLEAAWDKCCETTLDTFDMGEQDIDFSNPPREPKRATVSACCHATIGYDAWVDENGDVCGGPYDNSQCMDCGASSPEEVYEDEIEEEDVEA